DVPLDGLWQGMLPAEFPSAASPDGAVAYFPYFVSAEVANAAVDGFGDISFSGAQGAAMPAQAYIVLPAHSAALNQAPQPSTASLMLVPLPWAARLSGIPADTLPQNA